MNDEINIIPCGTKATFGNIEGWVGTVEITFTNILYKFEYFDKDYNHKFLWCHEMELIIESGKRQRVGFSTSNHTNNKQNN